MLSVNFHISLMKVNGIGRLKLNFSWTNQHVSALDKFIFIVGYCRDPSEWVSENYWKIYMFKGKVKYSYLQFYWPLKIFFVQTCTVQPNSLDIKFILSQFVYLYTTICLSMYQIVYLYAECSAACCSEACCAANCGVACCGSGCCRMACYCECAPCFGVTWCGAVCYGATF